VHIGLLAIHGECECSARLRAASAVSASPPRDLTAVHVWLWPNMQLASHQVTEHISELDALLQVHPALRRHAVDCFGASVVQCNVGVLSSVISVLQVMAMVMLDVRFI